MFFEVKTHDQYDRNKKSVYGFNSVNVPFGDSHIVIPNSGNSMLDYLFFLFDLLLSDHKFLLQKTYYNFLVNMNIEYFGNSKSKTVKKVKKHLSKFTSKEIEHLKSIGLYMMAGITELIQLKKKNKKYIARSVGNPVLATVYLTPYSIKLDDEIIIVHDKLIDGNIEDILFSETRDTKIYDINVDIDPKTLYNIVYKLTNPHSSIDRFSNEELGELYWYTFMLELDTGKASFNMLLQLYEDCKDRFYNTFLDIKKRSIDLANVEYPHIESPNDRLFYSAHNLLREYKIKDTSEDNLAVIIASLLNAHLTSKRKRSIGIKSLINTLKIRGYVFESALLDMALYL